MSINYSQTSFTKHKTQDSPIVIGHGILYQDDWMKIESLSSSAKHFIITDKTVDLYHGKDFQDYLKKTSLSYEWIVVEEGETSKSFSTFEKVANQISANGVTKDSKIIGFGGGVVNNLAGFLASTLYRGIGLIQIPTSFLAQVDAAIDSKQAINSSTGKNHIGSMYSPSLIIVDTSLLTTLSDRHIVNGLSETIKHAITQDTNLFNTLLECPNTEDLMNTYLTKVVQSTIDLKVDLLNGYATDFEYSEMLPQYGHSFGHAIEKISDYSIYHGEAIAIGMCLTAEIAYLMGYCDFDTVKQHYIIFRKYNLPTGVPVTISTSALVEKLKGDKHYTNGLVHSVLVESIGKVKQERTGVVYPLSNEIIQQAIEINRNRS